MSYKAAQMREVIATLQEGGLMPIITVYEKPKDYPQGYVARIFVVGGGGKEPKPTGYTCYAGSLYDIRQQIPQELYKIPREPHDDPVIVESWM